MNERRLELLQRDPATRYSDQGVIALDDTLIDHDGTFIKDVGWFWDHAEDRHKIAHDYLFVHSKEGKPGRPRAYVGDLKFNRKLHWN